MKDPFKRHIDYLRVSITDRCNLKCIYCIPEKGLKHFNQKDILTTNEIIRFISIAHKHGLRKVRLTGGEPLMRHDIVSLISLIREIGIQDLSMTTNGLLLTEQAGALKNAGLRRVNISLNTLNAKKYKAITHGGDIHCVWKAVREAETAGLYPIKINVVPIRGMNDDEILEFASLTFEKDYHIRFIEFMPIGPNKWSEDVCVKKQELMEKISGLGKLNLLEFKGGGPSRNYRIEGAKGVIGFISPISDCFCEHCNRLRLTAHGKILPCLFSDIEIDIKTPLREGISDRDIEALLVHAVSVKPERHPLGMKEGALTPSFIPSMSSIGG